MYFSNDGHPAPQSSQPPARLGVGGRGVGADQSHTEPASLRKRARRQSAEPDSPSSIDIASITTDRPDWEPAPRLDRHYIGTHPGHPLRVVGPLGGRAATGKRVSV